VLVSVHHRDDVVVDLLFEIANGFTAAIFNTGETDGSLQHLSVHRGCMRGLLNRRAGLSQQPDDSLFDQGIPGFSSGGMAADHILIIVVEDMGVLSITASWAEAK
jgi:hypothetical protein